MERVLEVKFFNIKLLLNISLGFQSLEVPWQRAEGNVKLWGGESPGSKVSSSIVLSYYKTFITRAEIMKRQHKNVRNKNTR